MNVYFKKAKSQFDNFWTISHWFIWKRFIYLCVMQGLEILILQITVVQTEDCIRYIIQFVGNKLYFFFVIFVIAQELSSFGSVCRQMLMDMQERLVYRTYIYIRSDILQYSAAQGDLAYPEKLEMMQVQYYVIQLWILRRIKIPLSFCCLYYLIDKESDWFNRTCSSEVLFGQV